MAGAATPDLSQRDQRVLRDLARVRLLSGDQLERLHFAGLATANARGSARRRSLARLEAAGLVTTLPRRVGGVRAGSAGLVYTLDARGWRLRGLWDDDGRDGRTRRPWAIGWPFVCHTLGVSELYVRLRQRERDGGLQLLGFQAEPSSWYRAGSLLIKPDAFAIYTLDGWEQHRWFEVDRSTESLPTLRRKLVAYRGLALGGDAGPAGVLPRVVVVVPDSRRQSAVAGIVAGLTDVPAELISVVRADSVLTAGRPPP